jgi:hypothetical protein
MDREDFMKRIGALQDYYYQLYTNEELPKEKRDEYLRDFNIFLDKIKGISSQEYHWAEVRKLQKRKKEIEAEFSD